MVYGANFPREIQIARSYGWEMGSLKLNWEKFNQARNAEIARLEGIYKNLLKQSGVDLFFGEGALKDPHSVEVRQPKPPAGPAAAGGSRTFTARYILIAAGGRPFRLPIEGAEHALDSNGMFSLKKLPKSFLALGAGYIALEFAGIFHGLGSEASVMFRKDLILSGFDRDLRRHLQNEMSGQGIQMLPGRNPIKIQKKGGLLELTDDKGESRQAEVILMATGRRACAEGLNLKALKLPVLPNGQIPVNKKFQTKCPSVFAVGDCAGTPFQLTPAALAEGMFVSSLLFSKKPKTADPKEGARSRAEPAEKNQDSPGDDFSYEAVPSAVFTHPEAGTVGLSEEQALAKGFHAEIFESRFRPLKLTLMNQQSSHQEKAYMKLVVCAKSQRVLGCHIVGEGAAEILQGFAVAIKARRGKQDFDRTMGIHPSSAEELVTMREPSRLVSP